MAGTPETEASKTILFPIWTVNATTHPVMMTIAAGIMLTKLGAIETGAKSGTRLLGMIEVEGTTLVVHGLELLLDVNGAPLFVLRYVRASNKQLDLHQRLDPVLLA